MKAIGILKMVIDSHRNGSTVPVYTLIVIRKLFLNCKLNAA